MGFKLRPAGGRSGLFLCPAWLTCPVLTFLQVRVGAGPGCAPTVQRPDLSAPVPCQPPLPPSLEEEVHQGLGALQGPLLPRGPRLLLPPLFLLLCRHEGAPGGLEGWAEGKDEGQGCGEGQRKGRVGGRRDRSEKGLRMRQQCFKDVKLPASDNSTVGMNEKVALLGKYLLTYLGVLGMIFTIKPQTKSIDNIWREEKMTKQM